MTFAYTHRTSQKATNWRSDLENDIYALLRTTQECLKNAEGLGELLRPIVRKTKSSVAETHKLIKRSDDIIERLEAISPAGRKAETDKEGAIR